MSTNFSSKPLFDALGCLIEAEQDVPLEELCSETVGALFETHGVILFRGFGIDARNFLNHVQRYSRSLLRMDAPRRREAMAGSAATVLHDFAGQAVPLHSENSYLFPKFWPEALWFNCEAPPESEGETTLCDGVALWNDMDRAAKELFLKHQLVYRVALPRALLDWGINADERGGNIRAALEDARAGVPGIRISEENERELRAEIYRYGVTRTRNGRDFAFVNHLLAGREPFLEERILLSNGQPLDRSLLEELRERGQAHTRKLAWQRGDLVMIDNRRVMHGRIAYPLPSQRRLLSAMTAECRFGYGHYARAA